jgi:valyl-tRNA synthetase
VPRVYDPGAIEEKWYAHWLAERFFEADTRSTKPAYSIVIPPPNVTGVLTMGHVLNNTIQDILARRARMVGKEVLWLPGIDHAGIATQTVVERTLKKQGTIKHRDDLGRERFVAKIWEWKEKHGDIIVQQLKRLGASCDWSRQRFTMDPDYSQCVTRVFVALYEKGLIYRGRRMVNWCPVSRTALSDEEVIMKAQNGVLYYFKVEVAELPDTWLTIATTRPETIPGDTAVAVNPRDTRYAHLIGKHVLRPLPDALARTEKLIPIIGDEKVEFEFGTGVLKVTPAHDKADYEIAERHGLPAIEIMNPDGTMNAAAGEEFVGLDRFEARNVAVQRLRELNALVKEEPYQNNVGFSERADVPIEPRLSDQWFLKYPATDKARAVVAAGEMKFHPERWANVYEHWMANIQDWCISRQLWWGHRIPVWYRKANAQPARSSEDDPSRSPDGAAMWCATEPPPDTDNWMQDPDVLDTWFSSWLWPFATMYWPEKTETLAQFYPTADLVTAPDIIFFWVARMIMAGFEFMGEMPFRNVYFTGIIRDKQGRKMSKSLGNSPDPLELIAKYGADALRLGVMRSAPLGQDVLFDEKNVELGRNFCTKLWNAARFRQLWSATNRGKIDATTLTSDDKWILLRLDGAIGEVSQALDQYRFSDATQALYRFFWSEFCDWYLEASKAALNTPDSSAAPEKVTGARAANTLAVIDFVLDHTLRLFHPFVPFITEELWHALGFHSDDAATPRGTIMFAPWPVPFGETFKAQYGLNAEAGAAANAKYETVALGRALRRDFNIANNKRVRFVLETTTTITAHDAEVLKTLLNAESFALEREFVSPKGTPTALTPLGKLFLPLEGLVDVATERERLGKEITRVEQELIKVRTKLNSPSFVNGAPANVIDEHRRRETEWEQKRMQLQKMKESLGG